MEFLSIDQGIGVLRLTSQSASGMSLDEQANGFVRSTPYLIVDLGRIVLTSMHIGELVNLANAARKEWGGRFPGLLLVGVSDHGRTTLGHARLQSLMLEYPGFVDAIQAVVSLREAERSSAAS